MVRALLAEGAALDRAACGQTPLEAARKVKAKLEQEKVPERPQAEFIRFGDFCASLIGEAKAVDVIARVEGACRRKVQNPGDEAQAIVNDLIGDELEWIQECIKDQIILVLPFGSAEHWRDPSEKASSRRDDRAQRIDEIVRMLDHAARGDQPEQS
ncbi:MAG: hypothetical protein L0Z55_09300 [Planctomycetes bacterium]|nr:hypothetical protein [Planctomycetota bacterium]